MYQLEDFNMLCTDVVVKSLKKTKKVKKNTFNITIVCDENDADYLTKISEWTIGDEIPETLIPEFLKALHALQYMFTLSGYFRQRWEKLPEELKMDLYNFEKSHSIATDYEYFTIPFEKFDFIAGSESDLLEIEDDEDEKYFDIFLHELFPLSIDGCNYRGSNDELKGCHTPKSIKIEYTDCNGKIDLIEIEKLVK